MLKIRCSAIGKIMGNPRKKSDTLSAVCKDYIQTLVIENRFGRKKEHTSRFTDKGIIAEDDSIVLARDVLDLGFIYKNEKEWENEYLTGTPDVLTDVCLLDVKSKWDLFTYKSILCNKEEKPLKDYFYQMQGYMALTGKRKSYLVFCLPDTPSHMVEDLVRKEVWNQKLIDETPELREHVEKNHEYSDINKNLRVVSYIIRYDKEVIKEVYDRIELCREYYNQINIDLDNQERKHEPREYKLT